jgi:hypothetical protein
MVKYLSNAALNRYEHILNFGQAKEIKVMNKFG